MRNIANLSDKDKEALFRNTAAKRGLTDAIIEKDFWVCYMLDFLFSESEWKDKIVFKGGTSLSKGFGLIDRFSEDIDLILDWRVLGYGENEPWEVRSNAKQEAFNREIGEKTAAFLTETFIPSVEKGLKKRLKTDFSLEKDAEDGQTVNFIYARLFNDLALLQEIRLEIGTLAAWTPTEVVKITPYAAEEYGRLFPVPAVSVTTVKPERTFWEKATILHREVNRKNGNLPIRYSRHYYDIYRMANTAVKERALADRELLNRVVTFKDKFYHCGWAKYDEVTNGIVRLAPTDTGVLAKLKDDYAHMRNMLFGIVPTFEEIVATLKDLEKEIASVYAK
jgi:hypothetical protein